MKNITKFSVLFIIILISFSIRTAAQEAPDALIKHLSAEVMNAAKADKDIQTGNRQKVRQLVEAKITPFVNFQHMTALAVGRQWRVATPDQKKALFEEFRSLLLYLYSAPLSLIKDHTVEVKPSRVNATDTEVEVRSQIHQAHNQPIQLSYRLEKMPEGWKIYDIGIQGTWLVETYKESFTSEINNNGIDGLIKTLTERNKKLAEAWRK